MHIYLGYDHAGRPLRDVVIAAVEALGGTITDLGSEGDIHDDYPDFAFAVAKKVAEDPSAKGILMCGTGAGMAIAANKIAGIRAATADTEQVAQMIRSDNDANILALAGRILSAELAQKVVTMFLNTPFEGGRHQRRVSKIMALENQQPSNND